MFRMFENIEEVSFQLRNMHIVELDFNETNWKNKNEGIIV